MTNHVADRLIHCRMAGRPARALMLSELLRDLGRENAEPGMIDAIAHGVAWHGFYCGRHQGKSFAVFQPAAEEQPAAHLLILVRDGGVQAALADQPLEATVIDYDSTRARIGIELPDHVPAGEFNRIREAVMGEFLADAPDERSAVANDTARKRADDGAGAPHCA